MVDIIRIPTLGLSDRGELVAWNVSIGDQVEEGQIVAVLESEKASAEIEATADGTLLETYVEEGDEIDIDVGRPLAVLGEKGEAVPSLEEIDEAPQDDLEEEAGEGSQSQPGDDQTASAGSVDDVKATPRAKRRAQNEDIDLTAIDGTGPQGAITTDDIEAYLDANGDEESSTTAGGGGDLTVTDARELTGTRKTIADRLSRSAREKPHVMGTREISIEQLERVRDRLEAAYDVAVSLNDLLLFFVARVLEELPEFNAHYEDGTHKLIDEVNLGYAVDGPRGLVVPVLGAASDRSLPELAAARRNTVTRVLENDYTAEDLQGGTFTVTNVGVFEMDVSYSIINPPEVAILAIGRRKYAPVERNGAIEFERVITFSLTIDHRVLDGADSGAFLDRLAEYLEYPGTVFESIESADE